MKLLQPKLSSGIQVAPCSLLQHGLEEDGEDRVWTTGNKRGMSISRWASSLWHCCGTAPSGGIILYSTRPFEVSFWRWWHVTSGPCLNPTRTGQNTHKSSPKPVSSDPVLSVRCTPPFPFLLFFLSLSLPVALILGSSGPVWQIPEQLPFSLVCYTLPCWWHWDARNLSMVSFQVCISFLWLLEGEKMVA